MRGVNEWVVKTARAVAYLNLGNILDEEVPNEIFSYRAIDFVNTPAC